MVCLILLVGHLWTCSGCLWPPHSGSVYIEVSVSMTAMLTLVPLLAHMDIVTVVRQTRTSYYRATQGHAVLYGCPVGGRGQLLLLTESEFFNYIKFLLVSFS